MHIFMGVFTGVFHCSCCEAYIFQVVSQTVTMNHLKLEELKFLTSFLRLIETVPLEKGYFRQCITITLQWSAAQHCYRGLCFRRSFVCFCISQRLGLASFRVRPPGSCSLWRACLQQDGQSWEVFMGSQRGIRCQGFSL